MLDPTCPHRSARVLTSFTEGVKERVVYARERNAFESRTLSAFRSNVK
jgi:hypothetical protein